MNHEFKQPLKYPDHNNNNNNNQQRPNITTPLKTGGESLFLGTPGSNPSPMTMFSEHFGDNGDFRSFSDLLMSPNGPSPTGLTLVPESWGSENLVKDGGNGFKQKRPGNLVLPVQVSPVFNISPGFSPSVFLTSPTFLSPTLSPFGFSPQHAALAHLTVQAHAAISQAHTADTPAEYHPPSSSLAPQHNTTYQDQIPIFNPPPRQPQTAPNTDKRAPHFPINVAKPQDDGYNWRKYGQKQVKGSEYPRSYYRCTSTNCPVKKKVERSFDGCITEIIYKGQHNHEPPQHRRSGNNINKDVCLVDNGSQGQSGNFRWNGRDSDSSSQATCMMLHGPSDSEESGENYQVEDEDEDDMHGPMKRSRQSDGPLTHRTMTEPKIVVQTRSEVDLLDDGYRWRKYGQKVVKGNPNPRSYYKCTTEGCKVRKHVERAPTDHRAVITTYEGKHNHDVPAPRGSSINAANYEAQQLKLHNSLGHMNFDNKDQIPAALRLKQEQNHG